MNRRQLLKLLVSGVVGQGLELDFDRLLWIPNQKKIFIPSTTALSYSQIVDVEIRRILPHIKDLFERDSIFYREIAKKR